MYGRLEVTAQQDEDGRWTLYRRGADGKRSPLTDVVVPDGAMLDDLAPLLEVAYHEWATPESWITQIEG